MLSLEHAQANFIATINTGPDALDPALFAGPIERILLGLKAHANTISHARLVALEDSFPITRGALGDATFNALSHRYIETVLTGTLDSNRIGSRFAAFLTSADIDLAITQLAQVEWAYLECYHAREAAPLGLSDLAVFDEGVLLALAVGLHPSVKVINLSVPLHAALQEMVQNGDIAAQPEAETCPALCLIRPHAEVRLHRIDLVQQAILTAAAQKNATLSNLLAIIVEKGDEASALGPINNLIEAGAFVATG